MGDGAAGDGSAAMPARVVVVMGVSGAGKTTVARLLAARLGWAYLEGDDIHPPANVAKMASGTPLTDEDRWPWLRAIAAEIDGWLAEGRCGVVTCSALKRRYRDILIGGRPGVRLVFLKGATDLLSPRLAARAGHFMPAGLLDSQFAALEPPTEDEDPIVIVPDRPPEALVETVVEALRQ
ncbi:gluconokinase [Roseomonas populi]|uniref:Gluconokinase n=1 Tax=Roseomonas populi TaxID=3121582 RepID=A0ABT1X4X0_9PROT|nr:gluconokinase [Roseomonas pecuniae]MCR0982443.1 gluconokinase [Roseomonas pecuniae]